MILAQLLTDGGGGKVGQLPDEIHCHMSCLYGGLVLLGATDHGVVHAVELADLADDKAGGGKGVAFCLEHILNGAGHIGKIQRHLIDVPIGHNFLDGAFDLPDVVGHIDGNVVAHIVG